MNTSKKVSGAHQMNSFISDFDGSGGENSHLWVVPSIRDKTDIPRVKSDIF